MKLITSLILWTIALIKEAQFSLICNGDFEAYALRPGIQFIGMYSNRITHAGTKSRVGGLKF